MIKKIIRCVTSHGTRLTHLLKLTPYSHHTTITLSKREVKEEKYTITFSKREVKKKSTVLRAREALSTT